MELVRAHQIIADMMKEELFLQTCINLLEEFQDSTLYPYVPKLILTTLSTFMKHQQSSSRLVRRIDKHTLNTALIEIFFRRTLQECNRLLIAKSYLHFIFATGSNPPSTQWKPSALKLSTCSVIISPFVPFVCATTSMANSPFWKIL